MSVGFVSLIVIGVDRVGTINSFESEDPESAARWSRRPYLLMDGAAGRGSHIASHRPTAPIDEGLTVQLSLKELNSVGTMPLVVAHARTQKVVPSLGKAARCGLSLLLMGVGRHR